MSEKKMPDEAINKETEEVSMTEASDIVDEEMEGENAGSYIDKLRERFPYTVKLRKSYRWGDKDIKEIDLSGLDELTTRDLEALDREMRRIRYPIDNDSKYSDVTYVKYLVSRITGLTIDFLDLVLARDMKEIVSTVRLYFLI